MDNIKGIEELKEQLASFEQDITASIQQELKRISRTVTMDEFSFIPFHEDVCDYIHAIRMGDDGAVVLETSFRDINEKQLSGFISDHEISHRNMIALLELLKTIHA